MCEVDSRMGDEEAMADGRTSAAGLPSGELPALVASLPRLTPAEADAFAPDLALAREEIART